MLDLMTATYDVDGMPPPTGYTRKLLSLPPELAKRVRELKFELRLDSDTAAYRLVIERGVELLEREAAEAKKGRRR